MNRITTGLIAILASLALLFVGAAPAEALVKRPISISAYAKGGDAHLKGHVGPGNTYQRRAVLIQRRICNAGNCAWHNIKTTRTNRQQQLRHHGSPAQAGPLDLPRGGQGQWPVRVVEQQGAHDLLDVTLPRP